MNRDEILAVSGHKISASLATGVTARDRSLMATVGQGLCPTRRIPKESCAGCLSGFQRLLLLGVIVFDVAARMRHATRIS